MSFGFSISDIVGLIQITTKTIEGTKKACGEYNDLTREVLSLHDVLEQLRLDLSDPLSLLHHANKSRKLELRNHVSGCEKQLIVMDAILEKYNNLGEEERSITNVWQKVRFGNGEARDLDKTRLKLSTYTSAIGMSLQLVSLGSQGRVERELGRQSGDIRGIREAINLLLAKREAISREGSNAGGSIATDSIYSNDDPAFWRGLRKDLNRRRFPSKVLKPHKDLILDYVQELSERGILNDGIGRSQTSFVASEEMGFGSIEERFISGAIDRSQTSTAVTLDKMTGDDPFLKCPVEDLSQAAAQAVEIDQRSSLMIDEMEDRTPSSPNLKEPQSPTVSDEMAEMARKIEYLEMLNRQSQEALKAATHSRNETERGTTKSDASSTPMQTQEEDTEDVPIVGEGGNNKKLTIKDEEISNSDSAIKARLPATEKPDIENKVHVVNNTATFRVSDFKISYRAPLTLQSPARRAFPNSNKLTRNEAPFEPRAEDILQSPKEREDVILFKDVVGRRFRWPYQLVKTWKGINELIQEAFMGEIVVIRPHVRKGHYDLIDRKNGNIIQPTIWETVIKPGQKIAMHMWPLPEPNNMNRRGNPNEQPRSGTKQGKGTGREAKR